MLFLLETQLYNSILIQLYSLHVYIAFFYFDNEVYFQIQYYDAIAIAILTLPIQLEQRCYLVQVC